MPARVTTRMYSPDGEVVDADVSSISLGLLPPSSTGGLFILDATLSGIEAAGDMSFGIASAELGGASISDVLRYGVATSISDVAEPALAVQGLSGQSGLANVMEVGFREPLVSAYLVLRVLPPESPIANGCFVVKWFFEYAIEE